MSRWIDDQHGRLGAGRTDGRRWWIKPGTPEQLPALLAAHDGTWRPVMGPPDAEGAPEADLLIDISDLDAVRSIDPDSGVAHVEAGCTWDALEGKVASRGLTIGPIPRWLVGRSIADTLAGRWALRPSPRYGDLRDALLALRAALPAGLTDCAVSPRRATGPDLGRTPLGADHRAGLITDIHIRLWPRPAERGWRRLRFGTWNAARDASVAILRAGVRPAWWCLHRDRRAVALAMAVDGPRLAGQLERLDAALEGLDGVRRDLDDSARELGAERLWDPDGEAGALIMSPLALVDGADLAAGVKGITKAEVWDLRPEGATIFVPRAAEAPAPDADWAALAERVFAALGQGGSEGR